MVAQNSLSVTEPNLPSQKWFVDSTSIRYRSCRYFVDVNNSSISLLNRQRKASFRRRIDTNLSIWGAYRRRFDIASTNHFWLGRNCCYLRCNSAEYHFAFRQFPHHQGQQFVDRHDAHHHLHNKLLGSKKIECKSCGLRSG